MTQIETVEAIENLDAILQVPGINAIYVGPSDLAMALGSQPRGGQKDPVSDDRFLMIMARDETMAGKNGQKKAE